MGHRRIGDHDSRPTGGLLPGHGGAGARHGVDGERGAGDNCGGSDGRDGHGSRCEADNDSAFVGPAATVGCGRDGDYLGHVGDGPTGDLEDVPDDSDVAGGERGLHDPADGHRVLVGIARRRRDREGAGREQFAGCGGSGPVRQPQLGGPVDRGHVDGHVVGGGGAAVLHGQAEHEVGDRHDDRHREGCDR